MFICVFAHASVLQLLGCMRQIGGKLTLWQKAMHWTIIIAYIFITNLPKSVDLPRRSSGKGSKFCEILVVRNSYMSMLQCYNEDENAHRPIACLVVGYDQIHSQS